MYKFPRLQGVLEFFKHGDHYRIPANSTDWQGFDLFGQRSPTDPA